MASAPERLETAIPAPAPRATWLAWAMFWLASVDLLLIAGLIHRAQQRDQVTPFELDVMMFGLAALWPVFLTEQMIGLFHRDRSRPLRPVALRAVLVAFFPPFRMGTPDPRTGLTWLPRLGWQVPDKALYTRIDRAFSGPMIVFALLILPVLALEFFHAEQVRTSPTLALVLHISISVIWVAFATEFILESSTAPKPMQHVREKWLDAAIVILPMLEFMLTKVVDAAPIARLLRLGRALSPEQITAMQRVYRLRGLLTKGWQAFLVLGGMNRLLGHAEERRLRVVEREIAEMEDHLTELRKEAEDLKEKIRLRDAAISDQELTLDS
jgi:voltage-gated potassium channel